MTDRPHQDLEYPFAEQPYGGITEIAPGLFWARMPLPYKLDHVNVWLLEDGNGWTVVDTGIDSVPTREIWETLLAGPMACRPVTRVVATHFHPDHIGLAGWLVDRFKASFACSLTEWLIARTLSTDASPRVTDSVYAFYLRAGLGEAEARTLADRGGSYARAVHPIPVTLHRLRAGDRLSIGGRDWEVVLGGGHSPEHVCLLSRRDGLLLAGDQILPRISPNVSVWASEPEADPLRDFLRTVERFRLLPPDLMVLPSHGRPFRGLHERLEALVRHHEDRLAETLKFCDLPQSVIEVTRMMFRRDLDTQQLMFAVGEALAHLNHLVAQGSLERHAGPEGLLRFARPRPGRSEIP